MLASSRAYVHVDSVDTWGGLDTSITPPGWPGTAPWECREKGTGYFMKRNDACHE